MSETRPNPDALLAQVQADEVARHRGGLKVFFGYAAGVGKTYAMLQAAQRARASGRNVVVGYVEPHARPETQALLNGLPSIPPLERQYRNVVLRELDVDAALAQRPEIVLVDELAHTNAEGCRHTKRWQDVEELLAAGIEVWTTLNVQHLESLNDIVGQITGVAVRETVPDHVFDKATDLELVDLPPEELLDRLRAGKIYLSVQAERALQKFFQKGNLVALRELSMRQAAQRVHVDVEAARRQQATHTPWATTEKLLVCIGPSPTTARVIRTAKRMAVALDAPWLAVSVDFPSNPKDAATRDRIAGHFALAERLGAETITLSGQSFVDSILEYARSRNVTKIVIGQTRKPRWRRFVFGTLVDDLLERCAPIDVYVIHGEANGEKESRVAPPSRQVEYAALAAAVAVVAVCGLVVAVTRWLEFANAEANAVMIFLAGVALVAFQYGRIPAAVASIAAVLVFDFFFVPPYGTFAVSDIQYVVTFGVMLAIGLLIGTLASRLRDQIDYSRLREQRTAALYELGRKLAALHGEDFLVATAGAKIAELVRGETVIWLSERRGGGARVAFGGETELSRDPLSESAVRWVIEHDELAGVGTNTLPAARGLFFPLPGAQGVVGALAIVPLGPAKTLALDQRRLLEACAGQLALALERDHMALDAAEARVLAESEQVRSTLLSSVSHDLKTPLAAIAGASSSLLSSPSLETHDRRQLLETISDEAVRLNRLLDNILQMSRLGSDAVQPNRQWNVVEEIVGSALRRVERELRGRHVETRIANDLPLVFVDELLIEQLLVNLLENAARYTPEGSCITISAEIDGRSLRLSVADNGPGLPPGSEERVFEKFYRARPDTDSGRGSGLGLAICRAVARVHGGTITAANRPTGGAEFLFRVPIGENGPKVSLD